MRATLVTLSLLAATVALSAQQNPFVGRWNIRGTGPDTNKIYFLEVTQKDGQLQAIFLDRSAHATPVAWIRMEGNELVWQKGAGEGLLMEDGSREPIRECGPIFRARLEGGKLVGSHNMPPPPCAPNPNARGRGAARAGGEGGGGRAAAPPAPAPAPPPPSTVKWVGTRQPVWPMSNANGFHTYGKPVVVVGQGVGKEAWTGDTEATWQTPCVNRWTYENGTMLNAVPAQGERPTCNIYTKEKFKDFKVEAELLLDQGQNSGFYIRGRYEMQLSVGQGGGQISGGTFGRQALGSIYGWKAPDFYAGKPPGQWQKLEAIVVGNRISAWFNDIRIHDNAELYAFTGGALDNDELAPGPIMIQGDHSRVTFRKLVVTPITKAGQ
jgi:hypothetical protein